MPDTFSMQPAQFRAAGRLFRALSDPTRLSILYLLQNGPANVSEVVDRTGLKQANISKQLNLMYDLGLLSRERVGNQVRYAISEPLIFDMCDLVCQKLKHDAKIQLEPDQSTTPPHPSRPKTKTRKSPPRGSTKS